MRITPKDGINANHYKYPVTGIEQHKSYVWELSGEMIDGKKFRVQKKVMY